ncbi:MAG: IS21 family transposase, partial [Acidimicrobiales bacterium]
RQRAFLRLTFTPGECAQVDWGEYGTIAVGNTRRKLSFFVFVLCHSRMMYLEFTVSQTTEHFLAAHEHAFAALGVPEKIMVDNLKSAVLRRLVGEAPLLNPRYLDFARHHGFKITPCNVRAGWEKGRVESGVGYVKKNFLNGLDLPDFSAIHVAARIWLDETANVRIHGETHHRPVDLFQTERSQLRRPNPNPYDLSRTLTLRASSQFRIRLDTNRYSVPAEYANRLLTVKAWPDRVCIYHQDQLLARHSRTYDRRQDIEDPDHPKALLEQRRSAREQRLLAQFLALCREAAAYYEGLLARQLNARLHLRRILALAEIHGREATARALADALAFCAFSSQYIAHLLEARARTPVPLSSPIALTRRQDLLELELPEPDLSVYEVPTDE